MLYINTRVNVIDLLPRKNESGILTSCGNLKSTRLRQYTFTLSHVTNHAHQLAILYMKSFPTSVFKALI